MKSLLASILGVWLGTMVFLMMATKIIFANAQDRQLAGSLVGALLTPYHYFGLFLGALALAVFLLRGPKIFSQWRSKTLVLILLISLGLVLVNEFPVHQQVANLRQERHALEARNKPIPEALNKSFGQFHGLSMGLNLILTIAVAGSLVLVLQWPNSALSEHKSEVFS